MSRQVIRAKSLRYNKKTEQAADAFASSDRAPFRATQGSSPPVRLEQCVALPAGRPRVSLHRQPSPGSGDGPEARLGSWQRLSFDRKNRREIANNRIPRVA